MVMAAAAREVVSRKYRRLSFEELCSMVLFMLKKDKISFVKIDIPI